MQMFRNLMCTLCFYAVSLFVSAGDGTTLYSFLDVPVSTSAAGGGGVQIASASNDLSLVFHNPGMLTDVYDSDLSLGFLSYPAGIRLGSLAYARPINTRSSWMLGLRYMDYGEMLRTDETGALLGQTQAKDIALTAVYAWKLAQNLQAGGSLHLVQSRLDDYYSFAILADLGIYYVHPNHLLRLAWTLRHMGAQLVTYEDHFERQPIDMQLGMSYKLEHAPLRFHATGWQLFDGGWSRDRVDPDLEMSRFQRASALFFRHLILGVDFVPSEQFMLQLGYNYRRVSDLGIEQRTAFGGFSAGVQFRVKHVDIGAAYARYHVSGASLQMSLACKTSLFGL